jgi:hypothetical protein
VDSWRDDSPTCERSERVIDPLRATPLRLGWMHSISSSPIRGNMSASTAPALFYEFSLALVASLSPQLFRP